MSTEHQQYSAETQLDTIMLYAIEHSLEITQVYTDSGKSGLRLEGGPAGFALRRTLIDAAGTPLGQNRISANTQSCGCARGPFEPGV